MATGANRYKITNGIPYHSATEYANVPQVVVDSYSDDNYYLLAYDPELAQFRTYRVDRMAYLGLTDKLREGKDALGALNLENYQKQTFSMYGGDVKHVTL